MVDAVTWYPIDKGEDTPTVFTVHTKNDHCNSIYNNNDVSIHTDGQLSVNCIHAFGPAKDGN